MLEKSKGSSTGAELRCALLGASLYLLGLGAGQQAGQQWEELICAYDWPCHEAMAMMWCESRGDPLSSGADNRGLFQINDIHHRRVGGDRLLLFDPAVNVRVAYDIWREQGWSPWGCRP